MKALRLFLGPTPFIPVPSPARANVTLHLRKKPLDLFRLLLPAVSKITLLTVAHVIPRVPPEVKKKVQVISQLGPTNARRIKD